MSCLWLNGNMYPNGQNEPQQPPESPQGYSPYQTPQTPVQPTMPQPSGQPYWNQPTQQQPYAQPGQSFNPQQQPAQPASSMYGQNPQPPYAGYNNQLPQTQAQQPNYSNTAGPQPTPNIDYMGNPSETDKQEYSIDYLNKIAPKEQKTVNKFAMIGLMGAGIFIALFAFIVMTGSNNTPNLKTQTILLSERITTLQTATEQQQTNLNEEQIYAANTALNSSLGSMSSTLTTSMKAAKIKENKKQQTLEKTYSTALNKTLNDAYQRGTLDRTYTTQMTYELSILRTKLVTYQKSRISPDLKNMSTTGIKDIDSVLKTLNEFGATKS